MDIQRATRRYESWLRTYTPLIENDLKARYKAMSAGSFPFLRATFFRWAQTWDGLCPDLADAPRILSVGDLHLENFGTWRDAEGRLIWGVNDLDESAHLPYTNDLVRLATSALLAVHDNVLSLPAKDACATILNGYKECLEEKGRPFVLAEENAWLRAACQGALRDPVRYWKKMADLEAEADPVPESARVALERALPRPEIEYTVRHRVAGLGSLGRPRYVALAQWKGGWIAREAKALLPSAVHWAKESDDAPEIYYQALLERAVRCRDPFVHLEGHWIVRRLAPDCSRIPLDSLSGDWDARQLLTAMGRETANLHLANARTIRAVRKDLEDRPRGWLLRASEAMAAATLKDWDAWRADPNPNARRREDD